MRFMRVQDPGARSKFRRALRSRARALRFQARARILGARSEFGRAAKNFGGTKTGKHASQVGGKAHVEHVLERSSMRGAI